MSNQLKTVIITVILAFVYVLTDAASAMAFGLDPSQIPIGHRVVWGVGGGAAALWAGKKIIVGIWRYFADGHVEYEDKTKGKGNK